MDDYEPTERTRIRRRAARARYDRATVRTILDEALIAHVAFADGAQPYVLPMAFVRSGDSLYLHGSNRARMLLRIARGDPVCATVTLLDGLVLARSAFHHSMNYRSVAVLGRGRAVRDEDKALRVLEALTEELAPGRWATVRQPSERELQASLVVEIPIEEVSAKVRNGPPSDDREDMALDVWAGTLPLVRSYGAPRADPLLREGVELPEHIRQLTPRSGKS